MVAFGGWEMPVEYTGLIAEHLAVRKAAGLFDVSHMGEFEVSGSGALPFLHSCGDMPTARLGLSSWRSEPVCDLLAHLSGPAKRIIRQIAVKGDKVKKGLP